LAAAVFFIVPVKKWWNDNTLLLVFVMLLASVLPTLLFVQKTDPWNIIQFTYYFIYLLAVLCAPVIYRIVSKTPKMISVIILLTFVIITPISSVWTFRSGLDGHAAYIATNELTALKYLREQPEGVVLTFPYNQYLRYAINNPTPLPVWAYQTSVYVSAYSNKQTYLEDLMQQGILGNDFVSRQTNAEKYLTQKMTDREAADFLKSEKIKYFYVPKTLSPQVNVKPKGQIIFENDAAIIYQYPNE
jgi:hypothetical protein